MNIAQLVVEVTQKKHFDWLMQREAKMRDILILYVISMRSQYPPLGDTGCC